MAEAEIVAHVQKLLNTAKTRGLTDDDINTYLIDNGYSTLKTDKKTDEVVPVEVDIYKKSFSLLNMLIFKVYPVIFVFCLLIYPLFGMAAMSPCLLKEVSPLGEAVQPLVNCDMCRGLDGAPRLTNLSQEDFMKYYAYSSQPILVEGAVSKWSALKVFSYDYFKDLYLSTPASLDEDDSEGQFFSYSSNIESLKHFFSIPDEVVTMQTEKWYIGW